MSIEGLEHFTREQLIHELNSREVFGGIGKNLDAVPLRQEESGAIQIGQSRVLLELVIHAFQNGATPEAIVQRYDTLDLPDMYAVVAYYLRHREDVEEYLKQREQQAVKIQELIESQQPDMSELRKRLLAQRQA